MIEDEAMRLEQLTKVLGNAVSYVTNEALVLTQYELFQEDKFGQLWPEGDNGDFNKRVNRIVEHLGGRQRCTCCAKMRNRRLPIIIPMLRCGKYLTYLPVYVNR